MNLSFQPGGFAPRTPQKNLRYFFFIFQKMGFWVIGIIRLHNFEGLIDVRQVISMLGQVIGMYRPDMSGSDLDLNRF